MKLVICGDMSVAEGSVKHFEEMDEKAAFGDVIDIFKSADRTIVNLECALTEKEEQLTAKLTNENKELFLDYVNTYNKFLSLSNSDSFISGFRLGAKFTYETFVKNTKG